MSSKKKCGGDCSSCQCRSKSLPSNADSLKLEDILKVLSAGLGEDIQATVVNLPTRKSRRNKGK